MEKGMLSQVVLASVVSDDGELGGRAGGKEMWVMPK